MAVVRPEDEQELVTVQNGKPMTTSMRVAEVFGKRHDHVLRDIEKIIEETGDAPNFGAISYTDSMNRQKPMYVMDRDGFSLLAMGFTGSKALKWKQAYIKAFNALEQKATQADPALAEMIASIVGGAVSKAVTEAVEPFAHRNEVLMLENREMAPKATFADNLTNLMREFNLTQVAKHAKVTLDTVRSLLMEEGYMTPVPYGKPGHTTNRYVPTELGIEVGLFSLNPPYAVYTEMSRLYFHFTQKGMDYVVNHPKIEETRKAVVRGGYSFREVAEMLGLQEGVLRTVLSDEGLYERMENEKGRIRYAPTKKSFDLKYFMFRNGNPYSITLAPCGISILTEEGVEYLQGLPSVIAAQQKAA
ncbi:MAG: Rha family transcriptional regulator [Pseudodesulfovibrio sp.]|uniref:Rha family transcriptional regulator n=1 Tax=Pseudodesulfovibrio sp. TaxID=2035812 RepID=UPI003D13C956